MFGVVSLLCACCAGDGSTSGTSGESPDIQIDDGFAKDSGMGSSDGSVACRGPCAPDADEHQAVDQDGHGDGFTLETSDVVGDGSEALGDLAGDEDGEGTSQPCIPGGSTGEKTNDADGRVWVAIPAGCFIMGCSPADKNCWEAELPAHKVTVSSFEILETEVTEAQYQSVTGVSPSLDFAGGGGPNSPVEGVTWYDAQAYCEAIGARLCTEAEWEYAARAGTSTTFPCGDSFVCLDGIAWYFDNAKNHKHDVKEKSANVYGLYDMLGNAQEWVEDCWHLGYDNAPSTGWPAWESDCGHESSRICRGGGFLSPFHYLRVSEREGFVPSWVIVDFGVRCCRSIEP